MSYRYALIDGSGFARAAYATGGGRQLPHRFLQRVMALLEDNTGIEVYVAWDPKDNVSGRRAYFPHYKMTRGDKELDQEYLDARLTLTMILECMGVHQAWSVGWEADDVIATLARGFQDGVLVLTRDRDLLQLVGPGVDVLIKTGRKERIVTMGSAAKELGMPLDVFTSWKALAGDSGDEVPGVPGIGAKKALVVLDRFPEFVNAAVGGGVTPAVVYSLGLGKHLTNILLDVIRNPIHLEAMLDCVRLHDVPLTFRRGHLDPVAANVHMRGAGLKITRARFNEWVKRSSNAPR